MQLTVDDLNNFYNNDFMDLNSKLGQNNKSKDVLFLNKKNNIKNKSDENDKYFISYKNAFEIEMQNFETIRTLNDANMNREVKMRVNENLNISKYKNVPIFENNDLTLNENKSDSTRIINDIRFEERDNTGNFLISPSVNQRQIENNNLNEDNPTNYEIENCGLKNIKYKKNHIPMENTVSSVKEQILVF